MPKSKMEVEIDSATSILNAMADTIKEIERWWPASKRGSNANRSFDFLKSQRETALLCLKDAVTND
jgi:hypothetical protein